MASVTTVVVGFILTGLIGNWLIQSWQARNWLLQQRFVGQEKEYLALKELADEIGSLLGARIYYMQRLAASLISTDAARLEIRTADYDDVLKRWNEKLTSFYVRLPLLATTDLAFHLESSIQHVLVGVGAEIEEQLHRRLQGAPPNKKTVIRIQNDLNDVQARAINFNKRMLRTVEERRIEVYFGKSVGFSKENLEHFSTWQLIKALFVRDVNTLSITRSAIDP